MKTIRMQFHALPSELLDVVEVGIRQFNLIAVLVTLKPFFCQRLTEAELLNLLKLGPKTSMSRIMFFKALPMPNASTLKQLRENNGDAASLELGRQSEIGLEESFLSIQTSDPELIEVGAALAKSLKKITTAGVYAVNPKTGERSWLNSHRYTDGALRLAASGIPILPVAGTSRLLLGQQKPGTTQSR